MIINFQSPWWGQNSEKKKLEIISKFVSMLFLLLSLFLQI